jgi:DNA topoisomerase-2
MAQTFVGSNNLPLLFPSGQFGTRLDGGKDAASPRYVCGLKVLLHSLPLQIYTRLSEVTRLLFPEEDDPLLKYACGS